MLQRLKRLLAFRRVHLDQQQGLPQHVAIVMDGNGRWASRRLLPKIAGHSAGVSAARQVVAACLHYQIRYLTLFAFSSENWRRSPQEISDLMQLFASSVQDACISEFVEAGVQLKIIGDFSRLSPDLVRSLRSSEEKTAHGTALSLSIAIGYGGRWDILQAVEQVVKQAGESTDDFKLTEDAFSKYLSLGAVPDPDLLIRTSGEHRVSNFLLWHLAYTELYFTPCLWPDFDRNEFERAMLAYQKRHRRFGS